MAVHATAATVVLVEGTVEGTVEVEVEVELDVIVVEVEAGLTVVVGPLG